MQKGNTTRGGSLGEGCAGRAGGARGTNERFGAGNSARAGDTSKSKEKGKVDAPEWLQQGGEVDDRGKR